ncbi:hypothetical protein ACLOJK_006285 [Asimina triloba]
MGGALRMARLALTLAGRAINDVVSFIVFTFLDLLDVVLCVVYRLFDFVMEAEWKPCYCSSAKEAMTSSGEILVSEQGESKIVRLNSSKLQLEDISDTLYSRSSLVSEISNTTVKELKRLKSEEGAATIRTGEKAKNGSSRSTFTINSTIVELLQGKIGGQQSHPNPRWSDCDCKTCASWISSCKETLFVKVDGAIDNAVEDVLFIHGFISSSAFWTETVFPNLSESTKSKYRLIAIDLLGFGRSPKPTDSLYTLRDHLDMIERSALEPYELKKFHIVAHSLGCILALALAVKHPGAVKSLTLLAPTAVLSGAEGGVWVPVRDEEGGPEANLAVDRVRCVDRLLVRAREPDDLLVDMQESQAVGIPHQADYSEQHQHAIVMTYEVYFVTGVITTRGALPCHGYAGCVLNAWATSFGLNEIRTFLVEGFCCHTHNAAWHTLHNIICGSASKMEQYLDAVDGMTGCEVSVFHGSDDELLPVQCSYDVRSRIPRASVKVIEKKDHITVVVGRQKAFASDLEEIWKKSSG